MQIILFDTLGRKVKQFQDSQFKPSYELAVAPDFSETFKVLNDDSLLQSMGIAPWFRDQPAVLRTRRFRFYRQGAEGLYYLEY